MQTPCRINKSIAQLSPSLVPPTSRRSSKPTPAFVSGDASLSTLPGIGPAIARKLAERGLTSLQDLWLHLPLRYEDRTQLTAIRALRAGEPAQVEGVVEAVERGFRYRPMLRVAIGDDSQSTLVLRFFHFRAAQVAQFAVGARVRAYGTPRAGTYGLEIVHPSYRVLGAADAGTLRERLDPVYPAIDGVGAMQLARLIDAALQRLPAADTLELLPPDALAALKLPSLRWPTEITAEMVSVALLKPDRMSTIDLFHYVRHLEANAQTSQRYEIEFWRKVFYPLSCMVMVVLALPFAYLHFRAGGITSYVFGGVLIGISFFLLNNVFGYIGNLQNWWPWLTAASPGLIYSLMSLAAFGWLVLRR